jgi:hypothetical protein
MHCWRSQETIKSLLVFIHLGALISSMGAILVFKSLVMSSLARDGTFIDIIQTLKKTIELSFIWLLISGGGLLAYLVLTVNGFEIADKVWLKTAIVVLMSLNSVYISKAVFPYFTQQNQVKILSKGQLIRWRICLAISLSGWISSIYLGLSKHLGSVYFFDMAKMYVLLLAGTLVIISMILKDDFLINKGPIKLSSA